MQFHRWTGAVPGLVSSVLISASGPSLAQEMAIGFQLIKPHQIMQSPLVNEASGLSVSPTDGNFMWVINDSGAAADLHLMQTDGTDRGVVRVDGARNVDWEDLAAFELNGKPYLLIADTGDNSSSHPSRTLYVLREPGLPKAGHKLEGRTPIAWKIDFQYEDGPRDCEAVAVDPHSKKILLISKRTNPPMIYQLPLQPGSDDKFATARKIGTTEVKAPFGSLVRFGNQPTGLDLSADGSMAAVVTYFGVFLFPHHPKQSWKDTFAAKPIALPAHRLHQAESIAFSKGSKTIYVLSEGLNSPIVRYTVRKQ